MIVWLHLTAALVAFALGTSNLVLAKGTLRHRAVGWTWIAIMLAMVLSSFAIRDLNNGTFSWIHGLSVVTLLSLFLAIISIRKGRIHTHAGFMIGTMAGVVIAGVLTLAPGRFISRLLGY